MVSNNKPINSRFEENLQIRQVAGPETYSVTTERPVAYLSVADGTGTVIGYVWANDEDDAAGWVVPPGKARQLAPLSSSPSRRAAPPASAGGRLRSTEKRGLMSSERPINPRFAEDMHLNFVSGPPRYRSHTDKPVRYVTVADKVNGAVLGYVWAGDEDDAAAWAPSQAAGARALADGGHWHARLQEAKERGLSPSAALSEMLSDPEGNRGRVLPDSLAVAPNAATVKALAAGDQPTAG